MVEVRSIGLEVEGSGCILRTTVERVDTYPIMQDQLCRCKKKGMLSDSFPKPHIKNSKTLTLLKPPIPLFSLPVPIYPPCHPDSSLHPAILQIHQPKTTVLLSRPPWSIRHRILRVAILMLKSRRWKMEGGVRDVLITVERSEIQSQSVLSNKHQIPTEYANLLSITHSQALYTPSYPFFFSPLLSFPPSLCHIRSRIPVP